MKRIKYLATIIILFVIATACNNNKDPHASRKIEAPKDIYTCPMPEDSVFSDKPGKCPKCGMDLIKKEQDNMNMKK